MLAQFMLQSTFEPKIFENEHKNEAKLTKMFLQILIFFKFFFLNNFDFSFSFSRYRAVILTTYERGSEQEALDAYELAYNDIKNAFSYFLENFCKNGRPFFLVGHSQGAEHLMLLLRDVVEKDPKLLKRLIAVYAGGCQVGRDTCSVAKVLESESELHGWIAWSTTTTKKCFSEKGADGHSLKNDGDAIIKLTRKPISVNLLSWTTSDDWADKSLHKGSVVNNKFVLNEKFGCKCDENDDQVSGFGGSLQVKRGEAPKVLKNFQVPGENKKNEKKKIRKMVLTVSGFVFLFLARFSLAKT